jgi:glutamine cyclotransferase
MDNDVEMIELKSDDAEQDGIFNGIGSSSLHKYHSCCDRRNLLTICAMVLCLFVGFFIGSTRFEGVVDPNVGSEIGHNDDEDVATTVDNQLSDGSKVHNVDGDEKVIKWLASNVSLRDGIKYEVVRQLDHDKESFTEGLCYADGKLYESVGLWKQSALLVLDPQTGSTLERYPMESKYFAEGLTYVNGKLIQLTYKFREGFIYDTNNLAAKPTKFKFNCTTNEGWGLTYDPHKHELIESDGSEFLHFWDPETMVQKRKVSVTRLDGTVANNINELEYWRGRVLANIWYTDILLVINPETGIVEKEYGKCSVQFFSI